MFPRKQGAPTSTRSTHPRRPSARALHVARAKQEREAQYAFEDASWGSLLSRSLVSGLTAAVNRLAALRQDSSQPREEGCTFDDNLTPEEVLKGVSADYTDRAYLWTGDIDTRLYSPTCTFTDPTLSFTGLATFQRNLAALRPLVRRIAYATAVELEDVGLTDDGTAVVARWRMSGRFRLPWHPALDIRGTTRFVLGPPERGGRIERYEETWAQPPAAALAQLVRAGPKESK